MVKEKKKDERPFICEYCNKGFKSKATANKHEVKCEAEHIKKEEEYEVTTWHYIGGFFTAIGVWLFIAALGYVSGLWYLRMGLFPAFIVLIFIFGVTNEWIKNFEKTHLVRNFYLSIMIATTLSYILWLIGSIMW